MKQVADSYAQQNFTKVAKQDEFLQLSAEEVISLIERDHLNVPKEEEVSDVAFPDLFSEILWCKPGKSGVK